MFSRYPKMPSTVSPTEKSLPEKVKELFDRITYSNQARRDSAKFFLNEEVLKLIRLTEQEIESGASPARRMQLAFDLVQVMGQCAKMKDIYHIAEDAAFKAVTKIPEHRKL
jgi:hypothetical protein